MSKVGVLYICTGKYAAFWDAFYVSAKENLCIDSELIFYVFTDNKELLESKKKDVLTFYKKSEAWPMPTLMRFNTFLSVAELYDQVDYLVFCNANLIFERSIKTLEIFGDKPYFATIHPGYVDNSAKDFPYEENKNSLAYISLPAPHYVCGGFNGGKKDEYLKMCEFLNVRIKQDLDNNFIAIWHDETHFNYFYSSHTEVFNVLSANYCHPQGWPSNEEPIVTVLNKEYIIGVRNKGLQYFINYYVSKLYRSIKNLLKWKR